MNLPLSFDVFLSCWGRALGSLNCPIVSFWFSGFVVFIAKNTPVGHASLTRQIFFCFLFSISISNIYYFKVYKLQLKNSKCLPAFAWTIDLDYRIVVKFKGPNCVTFNQAYLQIK